MNLKLFGL